MTAIDLARRRYSDAVQITIAAAVILVVGVLLPVVGAVGAGVVACLAFKEHATARWLLLGLGLALGMAELVALVGLMPLWSSGSAGPPVPVQ